MVDLSRLHIPEPAAPPRRHWSTALLAVSTFAAGLAVAHWGARWFGSRPITVTTATVQTAGSSEAGLAAGGWIEVARPAWPLVVPTRVNERIESIAVKDGDMVKPGQVLATMYDHDLKNRVVLTEARLTAAQREAALIKAGFRSEDISAAQARLNRAEATLTYARSRSERTRSAGSSLAQDAVDHAAADEQVAIASRAEALADLARFKAGYRPEELQAAEARVAEAAAERDLATLQCRYCIITVPDLGRPLRVLRVLHPVGTWIDKDVNHNLVELYDPALLQIRVDVPQRNVRQVAVGAVVEVRTDAHPDHTWSASVIRIEPLAELAKNTITVRAAVVDPDQRLFPEMTCQVLFKAEASATNADRSLRIPAQALRSDAKGSFVFVVEDNHARRLSVTAQPISGPWATISTGLRSGQRVITSDTANVREGAIITEQP